MILLWVQHTIKEVMKMNKKEQEKQCRQETENKFNSVTSKAKPENQNQSHNARREAVDVKLRQM